MDEKSVLSVSDWVAFLSSEKQGAFAGTLGFAAVIIALLALVITGNSPALDKLFSTLVIFAAYWLGNEILNRHGNKAGRILRKIMRNEYPDEASIRKAWMKPSH